MSKMSRITIRSGHKTGVIVEPVSKDVAFCVDSDFDLVKHWPDWRVLRDFRFESAEIALEAELQDRLARHVLVMLSFLRIEGQIRHGAHGDISEIVHELKFELRRTELDVAAMEPKEQCRVLGDIHRFYLQSVAENSYLIPRSKNPQSAVKARFSSVGLAEDLMMRSPKVSGNEFWIYAMDDSGELVKSRDIRLAHAQFLASLPGVQTYLEVGSGSGFCSLFLKNLGKICRGSELSAYRVEGARLLSTLSNIPCEFDQGDITDLPYVDNQFDVVFTCFVLEQCIEVLDRAILEAVRVARKYCVFLEPTTDFNATLPGIVHNAMYGHPLRLYDRLRDLGCATTVVRPRLSHYYNPGCIYIIDIAASQIGDAHEADRAPSQ